MRFALAALFVRMRRARGVRGVGLAALVGLAGCDHGAQIFIVDATPFRGADNRVVVDVELEAVEQSGRGAGTYCVSVHWFDFGVNRAQTPAQGYVGETDFAGSCAADLGDADRRTVRLVSTRTDLPRGAPARVQVRLGKLYETMEVDAP